MKKKYLYLSLIALFTTVSIAGAWNFKKGTKEKFKTTKVIRKDLVQTISASGKIKSEKEITLKFQTSGKLAWVGVKEGDRVKKWQAIASLDKKELRKKLKQELIDYMNERWDFEQTHEDYKNTIITDKIKRILEKAQFDLNRDILDVEIAHLAIELSTITSPIDGIVTHIDAPIAGINVTPATAKFTIADPDAVYFEANIDEIDISKVKKGQEVILTLDAYPEKEIKSEIFWIGFQAQTTRGGGTVFPIKIKLPENKNRRFKLGMNGDIEIILAKKEKALSLPSSAIMKKNGKNYVFAVKNNVAKKKEVKTGLRTDVDTEILSGINQEDEIIIEKLSKIKDGQEVK